MSFNINRICIYSLLSLLFFSACVKKTNATSQNKETSVKNKSINDFISNADCDCTSTQSFDVSVNRFLKSSGLKGASFALMKDGKLIYAKGYGMADEENDIPMESFHLLRVASVSKLFTAVGILKLHEEGQLSLDSYVFGEDGILNDPLFLDIKDEKLKKIRVIDLLTHTAGFSNPFGDACFHVDLVAQRLGKELPLTLDDMVIYASQNRLRAIPGTWYKYSNLGYVILSKVVEKVSGMDYEMYMKDFVFAPASCFDMHLTENKKKNRNKNEVTYYEPNEAEKYPASDGSGRMVYKSNGGNDIKLLYGAGAWCGSAAEILRFVSAIDNDVAVKHLLSDELITFMIQEPHPIGWAHADSLAWKRSGTMAGTNALLKREKDGYTWMFITNTSSWKGYKFNRIIEREIGAYINKVKEWPEQDLYSKVEIDNNKITSNITVK